MDKYKSVFDNLAEKLGRHPSHKELMDEFERIENYVDFMLKQLITKQEGKNEEVCN
jgi:hypothetical protein